MSASRPPNAPPPNAPAHALPPDAPASGPSPEVADLRVLAHPLRLRLLSLLTGGAYSAAEAARVLDQSQANVSYHLRRLHAAGLIEAAGEVAVRGGTAKRYRHDPDSGERVVPRSPEAAVGEYAALAAALGDELRRRTERRDTSVPGSMTDAEVWLAPDTWARIRERAGELGEELHAHALPPGTEGAVPVSATVMLFAMRATEQATVTEATETAEVTETAEATDTFRDGAAD